MYIIKDKPILSTPITETVILAKSSKVIIATAPEGNRNKITILATLSKWQLSLQWGSDCILNDHIKATK